MKRLIVSLLLFLFIVSVGVAQAKMGMMVLGGQPAVASAWPDFTYDVWIDYETEAGSDCDDTHLEATDNSVSSYTYTLTDASSELNCRDVAAVKNGTQGMSYDYSAGNEPATTKIAVSDSSISGGFWFYGPDLGNGDRISMVIVQRSGGYLCRISWQDASGVESVRVYGTAEESNTSVTAGNWYWITYKAVQNDQCYLTVYDTGGSQVGTELSPVAGDYAVTSVDWGAPDVYQSQAVSSYIDDFCLDTTDQTYPLGTGQ